MNWTLKQNGVEIAKILNFTPYNERTKIKTMLLDGTYNVQTIGTPAECAKVMLLVDSLAKLRAVNLAEADGSLVVVRYADTDYSGYIQEPINWTPILYGSVYSGEALLLMEDSV